MPRDARPPTSTWRNREYLLLRAGQTASAVGSQFSGFVIPLLVLALTNSPAQAGLVGALQGVPYIIVSALSLSAIRTRFQAERDVQPGTLLSGLGEEQGS
jgi:hypothetical protein